MRERFVPGAPLNEREQVTARERAGVFLWHDDIRPAPRGWVWARTNLAASEILKEGAVTRISLDHDLGLDYIEMPEAHEALSDEQKNNIFLAGRSAHTGFDLVRWMISKGCTPPDVTIHSWNPVGAKRMADLLREHGHDPQVIPYHDGYRTFCDV